MNFFQLYIGSTRQWMTVFLLIFLVGVFSPCIWQELWHIHHPHVITCNTFNVRTPFFWTGSDEDLDASTMCKSGFFLAKHGATIFGSEDNGSVIYIYRENSINVTALERVFRETLGNSPQIPYKSNSTFNSCILINEDVNRRKIVNVFCDDHARGVVVNYSGSAHALEDALNLIR